MLIKLHSQATTTPKVRVAIQASDEPAWVLAEGHGATEKKTRIIITLPASCPRQSLVRLLFDALAPPHRT